MSKVFVIERPRNNDLEQYANARKYGELVVLIERAHNPPGIFTPAFIDYIKERLKEEQFDPLKDYILVAGRAVQLVRVVAEVASRAPVNLLGFNASTEVYIPLTT